MSYICGLFTIYFTVSSLAVSIAECLMLQSSLLYKTRISIDKNSSCIYIIGFGNERSTLHGATRALWMRRRREGGEGSLLTS